MALPRRARFANGKRGRGLRETPILALSAHAMEEAVGKSREAGCDAYLTKPIRKETLLQAIAEHCKAPDRFASARRRKWKSWLPGISVNGAPIWQLWPSSDAGDYDAIRIMGHNMKGSGAGYGFDAITKSAHRWSRLPKRNPTADRS